MGIPASARAAWEKTGALTGRKPLCVLTTRQKKKEKGELKAVYGFNACCLKSYD